VIVYVCVYAGDCGGLATGNGGVGEGREKANTRFGMMQLCGGLACNMQCLLVCVSVCVCVCVCELTRQSEPRLFSPIREENKSKLFCLIIHSHSLCLLLSSCDFLLRWI